MRFVDISLTAAASLALVLSGTPPVAAAVQGVAQVCRGSQICPWFKPILPPVPGWVEDKASSGSNKLAILVPRGTTFASAPVRIYGRAFLNDEGLTVDQRVIVNTQRWREASPGASVERLANVVRAGGGVFQVYRYRNPGRTEQPVELTAFGEDRDGSGRASGVLLVLTATGEAELNAAEASFRSMLRWF
jgi:hypothetical protein